MSYRLDWHSNGSHWLLHGHVSFAEIFAANKEFYDDPRSDTVKFQLIDCTQVESVDWPDEEIRKIAAIDVGGSYSITGLKIAFASEKPEIIEKLKGYQQILKKTNSSWRVGIFENPEAALRWCKE